MGHRVQLLCPRRDVVGTPPSDTCAHLRLFGRDGSGGRGADADRRRGQLRVPKTRPSGEVVETHGGRCALQGH